MYRKIYHVPYLPSYKLTRNSRYLQSASLCPFCSSDWSSKLSNSLFSSSFESSCSRDSSSPFCSSERSPTVSGSLFSSSVSSSCFPVSSSSSSGSSFSSSDSESSFSSLISSSLSLVSRLDFIPLYSNSRPVVRGGGGGANGASAPL